MKKLLYAFSITLFLVSCNKETPTTFYEVNTSSTIGGEIDVNGGIFEENSIVTLTATPSNKNYQNYIFTGWSGTINSTDNPLNIVVSSNMSITANFRLEKIWEDELYSQLNSDPKSFVKVFIADAKRHGVDLSHVNLDTIEFEIKEMNLVAYSAASCDPNNVRIAVKTDLWELHKDMFNTEWKFRWLIGVIYHELGHDLLGLAHLCAGGHVMTGTHQAPRGECNGREENLYSLKYNNDDLVINWQRAVKDMFLGKGQVHIECNNNSSKGNNIIKEQYEIPEFNN